MKNIRPKKKQSIKKKDKNYKVHVENKGKNDRCKCNHSTLNINDLDTPTMEQRLPNNVRAGLDYMIFIIGMH